MRSLFSSIWAGIRATWFFVTLPLAWLAAFFGAGRPAPAPGLEAYAEAATAMPVNDVISDEEIRIAEMASLIRAAASARLDALESGDLDLARAADADLPPHVCARLDRFAPEALRAFIMRHYDDEVFGAFFDHSVKVHLDPYRRSWGAGSIAAIEAAAADAASEGRAIATGYRVPFADRLASLQARRTEEQASADEDLAIRFSR